MLNRRNVSADVSGRFNSTVDFVELVTNCHIVAAAMNFFGMKDVTSNPTNNALPSDITKWPVDRQWKTFSKAIGQIVDRYVIVDEFASAQPQSAVSKSQRSSSLEQNPHVSRITVEHSYYSTASLSTRSEPTQQQLASTAGSESQRSNSLEQNPHVLRITVEHSYSLATCSSTNTEPTQTQPISTSQRQVSTSEPTQKPNRHLPPCITSSADQPHASRDVHKAAPDGVFNYASAVLNDGLLLLEFRDAIHEGDGLRIMRCWKFLLLYFRFAGHTKYAQEALNMQLLLNGSASPRVANQLCWGRVVSTRGGKGHNLPIDLHMEHLNRCVKDYIVGLGANVKEETIIQISKSLKGVLSVCNNFDKECHVHPVSLHHTKKSSKKDEELVIKELTDHSHVFDYIPGRKHASFPNIQPHVANCLDTDKMFKWLKKKQSKASDFIKLKKLLGLT